jgi:carotenoid cleavage dioxygenase-like enzyme
MNYQRGFATQTQEITLTALPLTGTLPAWLQGTLIRNGPGQFAVGEQSYRHWFDGLAMLHAFTLHNGQVGYVNRFLRSPAYERDTAAGKLHYRGFAVDPCRSLFGRVMAFFANESGGNNNVNITQINGHALALTETPLALEFDPQTLATVGVFGYDDTVQGQVTTAHPHYDRTWQAGVNYVTHFGAQHHYRVYRLQGAQRQIIAEIPVAQPAYMHSFALTERYIVLAEFSLRLPLANVLNLAFGGKPFIQNFVWQPNQDTVFTVIEKTSGKVSARVPTDAFFAFHHINAFERDGGIVLDVCAYPDAHLIEELYLEALHRAAPQSAAFRRYHIPLSGGRATYETITEARFDLPRIHYERCNGREYRYVYGAGVQDGTRDFLNQIVKVDIAERTTHTWYSAGCYPSEPVFVPAPNAAAEDDGVVLSVVLDSATNTSFLLVLDAATLREIARAQVPQHVPFGFHGQFWR